MFGAQQPRPHLFNHEDQYTQRPAVPTSWHKLSKASRSLNNQTIPMNTSHTRLPHRHFQANVAEYDQHYNNAERVQVTQTSSLSHHPKGPCFTCGIVGHFATDCRQCKETHINYMDSQDPEMNRLLEPTIQPWANIAQLRAQLDTLDDTEHNDLIQMMGKAQPQDFPSAWSGWHWSSEDQHQMYTCQTGNWWHYDFSSTWSWKELKQSTL